MKVLVVFDHPRRDSFCGSVLDNFLSGLRGAGHVAEVADLRAEGFDPRLPVADEPDWDDDHKVYSDEVLAEQARITRNEALAFIFPVWWWSLPAATKGWIDRVWNNGWAYGARKLPHHSALLIGTASATAETYRKRRYDDAMRIQLTVGIMEYCGIKKSELEIFYDVMESEALRQERLAKAKALGATYFS